MKQLFMEVVAVVLVVVILLAILSSMGIYATDFWSSLLVGTIVGTITHLGFEAMGLNKYYCEHGYACKNTNE